MKEVFRIMKQVFYLNLILFIYVDCDVFPSLVNTLCIVRNKVFNAGSDFNQKYFKSNLITKYQDTD